jgi:flagellar basal body rod protein FlgG
VNTNGYKQQIMKTQGFQNIIDIAYANRMGNVETGQAAVQLPHIEPVVDDHSGALKFTGKPLDVAMQDNVYLAVQSTEGELYTRQGDLHIDARGRLVTASGLPVQGMTGEIRLASDKPVINQQGQIYIDEQPVAELKLMRFPPATELQSLGNGLYRTSSPGQAGTEENLLRQGYIEASNVNMNEQMIRMIELTRHFESTQRLLRGYDEMLGNAINEIADFEGL